MARVITLKGWAKWNQLLNFSYLGLQDWEGFVKDFLTSLGWSVQSVQLSRQSYLNNFLNVTVQINAADNDSYSRITNGVTNALKNFVFDGERKFSDAGLSFVSITGASGPTSQQNNIPVVNGGSLAVVDVKIPASEPNIINIPAVQFEVKDESTSEFSPTLLIVGGLLLVFLLRD